MSTFASPPLHPGDDPTIAVASLYQEYLVTRQTGRAVRDGIEQMISDQGGEAVAVIDFRDVVVIDFSCADEVVAKLVLDTGSPDDAAGARFVLVRGVREHHLDPVDGALRHRGLAVAAVRANGEPVLLGDVDPAAGEAWRTLCSCGRIRSEDLARMLDDYYDERGWDLATGHPTAKRLQAIGLADHASETP